MRSSCGPRSDAAAPRRAAPGVLQQPDRGPGDGRLRGRGDRHHHVVHPDESDPDPDRRRRLGPATPPAAIRRPQLHRRLLLDDDVDNLALFKQVDGRHAVGGTESAASSRCRIPPGRWRYLQITQLRQQRRASAMTGADPTNEVIHHPLHSRGHGPAQPSGRLEGRSRRAAHAQRRHRLHVLPREERQPRAEDVGVRRGGVYSPGIFNPDCDGGSPRARGCPTIGFTPVVENVEDLQVAYVFRDGTVWNYGDARPVLGTAGGDSRPGRDHRLAASRRPRHLERPRPPRLGHRAVESARHRGPAAFRGPPPTPGPTPVAGRGATASTSRPALEDHAEGPLDTVATGVFDRYRLTTTLRPPQQDAGVLTMQRKTNRQGPVRRGAARSSSCSSWSSS